MPLVIPNQFTPSTVADANAVNANFSTIATYINNLPPSVLPTLVSTSMQTSQTAAFNSSALVADFLGITNAGGGIDNQPLNGVGVGGRYWITQNQFQVNASVGGIVVPNQTVLEAAGYGGRGIGSANAFYHFVANGSGASGAQGLLFLNFSGDHTQSGNKLLGVSLNWNSTNSTDMALYMGTWNVWVQECSFRNVPVIAGFSQLPNGGLNSPSGLTCVLDRCTSFYGFGSAPDYATQIWFGGQQSKVGGPSEYGVQEPSTYSSVVWMSIGGGVQGVEHNLIEQIHAYGYNYCIDYADINNTGVGSGCWKHTIREAEFSALATAINCTMRVNGTQNVSNSINDQAYYHCTIDKSPNSTNAAPIVLIDTNGTQANANLSSFELTDCLIYSNVQSNNGHTGVAQNNQYGVQINGGDSVQIKGGKIGNVGNKGANTGTANIAITSSYTPPYNGFGSSGYPPTGNPPTTGSPVTSTTTGPTEVLIQGVDLRPTFVGVAYGNSTGSNGSAASAYAFVVSGTQNGTITVRNCDMTGYTGSPCNITATINGNLYITDCPGYNTINQVISTTIPLSGTYAAGVNSAGAAVLGGGAINYYGPSFIEFINGTGGNITFTIAGATYTIPNGQYVYRYLENAYVAWALSTATNITGFRWRGK